MSRASGMVPASTAAETRCTVSFWLIMTTSTGTPRSLPHCLTRWTSMALASSEKISPPQ